MSMARYAVLIPELKPEVCRSAVVIALGVTVSLAVVVTVIVLCLPSCQCRCDSPAPKTKETNQDNIKGKVETSTQPPVAGNIPRILYKDHARRASGFPCKIPQPRAFITKELIKNSNSVSWVHETDESVSPYMTVLHRCDSSSGCCGNAKLFCMVANHSEVILEVIVNKVISWRSEGPKIETMIVTNHTACTCQEGPLPK